MGKICMRILTILFCLCLTLSFDARASYLSCVGNHLVDAGGKTVRLTGVNWFGFETSNCAPHGLWTRDYKGVLIQAKQMGFNCVRIPWSNKIMQDGVKPSSISTYGSDPMRPDAKNQMNLELVDKTSIEVLDLIVDACTELGLKVILDNHSRKPDGYIEETLWYTKDFSDQAWIDDWVKMAKRYAGNSTVIAFDLDNEPHGKENQNGALWGTGVVENDWRLAAERCGNAILKVNPDGLIIVEGTENAGTTGYWWGGNLTGVATAPVRLSKPEKLVYSPHEYGPEVFAQTWFSDSTFPENMPKIWDTYFGYIYNAKTAPLLCGEFGIRDAASFNGKAGVWFKKFLAYMGDGFSWTFWCLNPNSGDTGGLLDNDWTTVVQWKLDLLKPYLAPMISPTPTATVRPGHSGKPAASAGALHASPVVEFFSVNGKKINYTQTYQTRTFPSGVYIAYDSRNNSMKRRVSMMK
jgi:endoglucanase